MKRELPKYDIEGTAFFVDVEKLELRQVDNVRNRISFLHDMQIFPDHYLLRYDLQEKNKPYPGDLPWYEEPHSVIEKEIPMMVKLDPDGMAEKFNLPLGIVEHKTDFDLLVSLDALKWRFAGNLPSVSIGGELFTVDTANYALRHAGNPAIKINLYETGFTFPDEGRHFFYNPDKNEIVKPEAPEGEIPEKVVSVNLPSLYTLDAVGVWSHEPELVDYISLLMKYPVLKHVPVSTRDLTQSEITSLFAGERELPVFNIAGTDFLVDVQRGELRQANDPENTIPFTDMRVYKDHYEMDYSPEDKNMPTAFSNAETVVIKVPPMTELDPLGMSWRFKISPEEIIGKTDFDLMVDQELVARRESGILPTIDIAGHPFVIDLRLDELRPVDDFSVTPIKLSKLGMSLESEDYNFFYNPKTREVVTVDESTVEISKDVIWVTLPNELYLDPVGYAWLANTDPAGVLMDYPIQKDLKAQTSSIQHTGVLELIAENRRNAGQGEDTRVNELNDRPYKKGRS